LVEAGGAPHHLRVEVLPVRDLALVQLGEDPGLDLPGEEGVTGNHEVIAGSAGEQLALEHVIGVEGFVDDLDAKLAGEIAEHGLVDVVHPVVDANHGILRRHQRRGEEDDQRGNDEESTTHPLHPPGPVHHQ
jgi:hypothetical protein